MELIGESRWSDRAWAFVLGLGVFAVQIGFWRLRVQPYFSLTGDEFSLLAHSAWFFHPSASDWFLHGFSGYFAPFPDKAVPYSNFIRPMANLTYFGQSLLFGHHWSFYLWANYAFEAALVAVSWMLARTCFGIKRSPAFLVAAACAVSPAYNHLILFRPSFAFDLLGGVFVLATLFALLHSRWLAALLFVTCAVLTKESAYFASLSSAVAVWALGAHTFAPRKRATMAALYALPALAMLALRKLAFQAGTSGVYVLNATTGNPFHRLLHGLTNWPYSFPAHSHLVTAVFALAMWCLLCAVILRKFSPAGASGVAPDTRFLVLTVFLLGSMLLPVGLDLANRFGAATYPLLFLFLGYAWTQSGSGRMLSRLSLAALILTTVVDARVLYSSVRHASLQEHMAWARSHRFLEILSKDPHRVSFLAADGTEDFSSPESVKRVSGYQGVLVPVSDADVTPCTGSSIYGQATGTGHLDVHSHIPSQCGQNSLGATFYPTSVPIHTFTRDLPEAKLESNAHNGGWENGQFGTQDLDVVITPKVSDYVLLLPTSVASTDIGEVRVP